MGNWTGRISIGDGRMREKPKRFASEYRGAVEGVSPITPGPS